MGSSQAATAMLNTSAILWLSRCNKGKYVSPKGMLILNDVHFESHPRSLESALLWQPKARVNLMFAGRQLQCPLAVWYIVANAR
jgi:hypothetical protein